MYVVQIFWFIGDPSFCGISDNIGVVDHVDDHILFMCHLYITYVSDHLVFRSVNNFKDDIPTLLFFLSL